MVSVVKRKQVSNRINRPRVTVATHRERGAWSGLCRGSRYATGWSSLRVEVATYRERGGYTGLLSDQVCN